MSSLFSSAAERQNSEEMALRTAEKLLRVQLVSFLPIEFSVCTFSYKNSAFILYQFVSILFLLFMHFFLTIFMLTLTRLVKAVYLYILAYERECSSNSWNYTWPLFFQSPYLLQPVLLNV